MAQGTSPIVPIPGAELQARNYMKISPIQGDGVIATPPVPNGTMPSVAMSRYQNSYRDFAFQKITPPDYGYDDKCIARITGLPINEPDYIADYHFIGMMRCIDDMLQHGYVGYIGGTWETPKPTKN